MNQLERVYGIHAVEALLLNYPKRVEKLWLSRDPNDLRIQKLIRLARDYSIPITNIKHQEMNFLLDPQVRHQGIFVDSNPSQVWSELMFNQLLDSSREKLVLVLDNITDPYNLGACLRTALAAGALSVIIPKNNSASLTSSVRKVACGAAEIIPLVSVTNLVATLKDLKKKGFWIFGTDSLAETEIYDQDLTGPVVLVMGSENKGMRRLTRAHCDHIVSLPMQKIGGSLNVSVATGICLFEAVRQRKEIG